MPAEPSLEPSLLNVTVDSARLLQQLEQLASFSSDAAPAVTRVLYSPEDMAARDFLKKEMAALGLELHEDPLGTLFARWVGQDADAPAVATGSHIDAIPHAGRYDGTVGVLGALEAFRALRAAGFQPRRSLELILFTAEEPTRFGVGCLGSRAMASVLSPEDLRALRDDAGRDLDSLRQACGFAGSLEQVALRPGHYHAFIELHIEQGPLLEQANIPIGVVSAIAAPATLHITITGEGGHAGAVLMPARKDALVAAAELACAVENAARNSASPDNVATVGKFEVHPGAVNSIPSRVFMTADVRDIRLDTRDASVEQIQQQAAAIAERRQVRIDVQLINADPPAQCGEAIIHSISQAAKAFDLAQQSMVSRAYHDALFMARLCPTGMIFIPCHEGISHRPDEYSSPEAIAAGVQVLAHSLAQLSLS